MEGEWTPIYNLVLMLRMIILYTHTSRDYEKICLEKSFKFLVHFKEKSAPLCMQQFLLSYVNCLIPVRTQMRP